MKIYSIDYLLITHEDFDHNGAKDSLMNNYKVSNVVDREECFPLKVGNVLINNLNPYAFTNDRGENNSSLVLDFTLAGQKFLLMGDASKDIEKAILRIYPTIDCDILKVGHHGSNTSSGFDFIKTISPREAVISVGKNNNYGHPHLDVLNTLRHFGVVIRRTDLEGTICYY